MSYEPTNWKSGDKVTSTRLNKIEQGIQGIDNDTSSIKEDLNNISYAECISDNFLNPVEETGMYDASTGAKTDANYMVRTPDAIKIPDNTSVIYIKANKTFTNYLGVFEYATEDTNSFIRVRSYTNTDSVTYTLHADTHYIRLNISNNYSISDFSVNTSDVAYNKYEEQRYITKTALPAITDEELPESVILSQIIKSRNLFNNADIVANEWIKFNGQISADANYYHSNAIVLSAGDYLTRAFKAIFGTSGVYVHLYDSNDNWIGKVTGTYLVEDGNNSLMAFTLPQDSIVKINIASAYRETDMIVTGSTVEEWPDEFIPYKNVTAVESGIHLNEDMEEDVNKILGAGVLYGKKLAVNGDSICYGVGYVGGYAKIIGENNDMTVQNIGIGGGTIATGTTANGVNRHWISTTVENLDANSDYILLEGGVNDSSLQVTLGPNTASYDAEFDTTTFYGALNYMFKVLISRFAGKKYGFIIPHQMSGGMMPNGDYYNAVLEVAKKWGVPVLDLSLEIPPFGRFVSTSTLYALTTAYTNNGDGWHPNKDGYEKYYVDKITAWMKTL